MSESKKICLKREQLIAVLDEYYKSIGREKTPNYRSYSLLELTKCLFLFNLSLNDSDEEES